MATLGNLQPTRTPKYFIDTIQSASDNMEIIKLITIHDDMLSVDANILHRVMKHFYDTDKLVYDVFVDASKMSKVDKKGVFKKIIANAVKRESVTD